TLGESHVQSSRTLPLTKTALLLVTMILGVCPNLASAQTLLPLTYVSAAIGDDANNCDRITPCRSFVAAHRNTAPGGTIAVLDPGEYGFLLITKPISIVNAGAGEASILVYGGNTGITINAPAAGYVHLRGLTIQGVGSGGGTGVRFNSGLSLSLDNC